MPVDEFQPLNKTELDEKTPVTDSGPDPIWAERIRTVAVGNGFRIKREIGESTRQLKRRINRAAMVSYRELEWFPEGPNMEDAAPGSYIVKVRSLDLKAKARAEATPPSNSSQESQQTPSTPEEVPESNPNDNAPQARVRGR